jgi:translocation protein SEC63
MLQCLIQAVPVSARKAQGRVLDNPATVMQLPHMDAATVKALRNKNKIKSLQGDTPRPTAPGCCVPEFHLVAADLQDLSSAERTTLLRVVGLSLQQAEEVDAFIAALPTVSLVVECGVDGEDAIYEQDIVKCSVLLPAATFRSVWASQLSLVCPSR